MLYLNTINAITNSLLVELGKKDYLSQFALVGGTSLSLRFGHRLSIDIDLFSTQKFDPADLLSLLEIDFAEFESTGQNKYMLFCYINAVKSDFVYHPFKLIEPIEEIEHIKMFSLKDVAAMKLSAVTRRGSRKDFYDIWQLLQVFSPQQLIKFFETKYGEDQRWMLLNSICYFEDADAQKDPEILVKSLDWNQVKKTITKAFHNIPL